MTQTVPLLSDRHRVGLFVGVATGVLIALSPTPEGLPEPGWLVVAVGSVMAIWWVTEAAPLAVAALLPALLFPLLGVTTAQETLSNYADPVVFLFFGGFLIALALHRWGVDRRMALAAIGIVGRRPTALLGGMMAVTAFLSLWISNTATAMVMVPIARTLCAGFGDPNDTDTKRFGIALLLGTAYAATIGGMGSLIGSPPNALFAAYMQDVHGVEIGFADWMMVGIPTVLVLLPLSWALLAVGLYRSSLRAVARRGDVPAPDTVHMALSAAERRASIVFALAAMLWIGRPFLGPWLGFSYSDMSVALLAGISLFLVPNGQGGALLDWTDTKELPWSVLILFGGGLALAHGIEVGGVARWVGDAVSGFSSAPVWLLALGMVATIVYLGELASNTAIAAIFLPVAGAAAAGLGLPVTSAALIVALAASIGFMLPVATPPNALVFGTGSIKMSEMLQAGALLDIAGIAVVLVVGGLFGGFGNPNMTLP